jgi:hypothetical protein
MATVPDLPLFYKDLVPLSATQHKDWKIQTQDKAPFLAGQHAVPVTIDEFVVASRFYPVVFSVGEQSVPLALMGLNEGVNLFVDDEGKLTQTVYVPAYVRRYPFLLAKLSPDADELSLCFDPTSDLLGEFAEGVALFEGDQPTEACKNTLAFCEQFEQAGQKTAAFIAELDKHGLLIDGEVAIQQEGAEQPYIYRGFRMVDETKLRDVRGDVLRGWNQSGLLPLLYAHLFSLDQMRELFARQVQEGKGPIPAPVGAA